MQQQPFEIKTRIQILKPVHEVFEAIVDPVKMSNYFIAYGSGRMEEGKTVTWQFPEFDEESPVRVGGIKADEYISFHWSIGENEMLVEMELTPAGNDATVVTVREKATKGNGDITWLKGNTEGWANFLACLKAYLEYNINLRKGAFDFMKTIQAQH